MVSDPEVTALSTAVDPTPEDLARSSGTFVRMRWAAAALVPLATALCVHLLHLPLPEVPLYAIGAAILVYNAVLGWSLRRYRGATGIRRGLLLQVALDWISMAIFVHLTGGVTSPAVMLFLIHMLVIAILLPDWPPYIFVGLGMGVVAAIALVERFGLLPHVSAIPDLPPNLHLSWVYLAAVLFFIAATAFPAVYLTASIVSRARDRERQMAALLAAAHAVSSTLSLPEVMERLSRSAANAVSAPAASMRLLDETGERLTLTASVGLSQDYLDKGPVEVSHSPLDDEALLGKPVIIADAAHDPRIQYPREVAEEGIQSMLVAPIIGRGRPVGVLRVYSFNPGGFSDADVSLVEAIAHQSAAALENAIAHEALQDADTSRAQFVRVVTHELRAPVTGAQSLMRVLLHGLTGTLTAEQQDILGRLERRLDLLLELINDLLALAASKTEAFQQAATRLPLQPILRQSVERQTASADEKHLKLELDAPFEALPVSGTEDGLQRIFDNLVGNAVKYTPDGGKVWVRVVERPPFAVTTVQDTGIGIPATDLPNLWNEFYRASNARHAGITGTGLGLAIVRQLVEQFGGTVSVSSVEGKGTTFKILLPLDTPGDSAPQTGG